jgi:hypothetical protein
VAQKTKTLELAEAAFRAAMRTVLKKAREHGTPVITMKDGRVQAVDPWTLEVPEEPPVRTK